VREARKSHSHSSNRDKLHFFGRGGQTSHAASQLVIIHAITHLPFLLLTRTRLAIVFNLYPIPTLFSD